MVSILFIWKIHKSPLLFIYTPLTLFLVSNPPSPESPWLSQSVLHLLSIYLILSFSYTGGLSLLLGLCPSQPLSAGFATLRCTYYTACHSRDGFVHIVGAVSLSDRVDPHHCVRYILCMSNDLVSGVKFEVRHIRSWSIRWVFLRPGSAGQS
jgi:hypothetical protein